MQIVWGVKEEEEEEQTEEKQSIRRHVLVCSVGIVSKKIPYFYSVGWKTLVKIGRVRLFFG